MVSSAGVDITVTLLHITIAGYLQRHCSIREVPLTDVAVVIGHLSAVGKIPVQLNSRKTGSTQNVYVSLGSKDYGSV